MSYGEFDRKSVMKLETFDGGLNTKASPIQLDLEQSPDCQNVEFTDFGAVATVEGFSTPYDAIASAVVDGCWGFVRASGTAKLVAQCNGNTNRLSGTAWVVVTESTGVFTAGVDVHGIDAADNLILMNGNAKSMKYNGSQYTKFGVSAPTATLTVATDATAGNLTGDYNWVYSKVNTAQVEGNYSPATATYTAVGEEALVSGIPTAAVSDGVDEYFLYRNTAAAAGIYYRVTAISNGVTSFTDNIADSTLLTEADTDSMAPRNCKFAVFFQGTFFMAGETDNPSYLWYSEVNEPEHFKSTNFVRIGDGDGMVITGVSIAANSVIIDKADKLGNSAKFALYTSDSFGVTSPDNWYLIQTDSSWGSESNKGIVKYNNLQAFPNRDGFYGFTGNDIIQAPSETNLGRLKVDSLSFDIEPDVMAFKKSLLPKIAGINFNNKIWWAVPSTSSSTENDVVYSFDYVRASTTDRVTGAWGRLTSPSVNNWTIHEDELYGGSSVADGQIYKMEDTVNYDGSAIDSYYITAPFAGDKKHENWIKLWRYAYIIVEASGDWEMNLNYIVDFDKDGGTRADVDLSPDSDGGFLWGTGLWDAVNWSSDGVARKRVRVPLGNSVGQYLQFKFWTNAIDRYWKVHRIEVFYKLRGARD